MRVPSLVIGSLEPACCHSPTHKWHYLVTTKPTKGTVRQSSTVYHDVHAPDGHYIDEESFRDHRSNTIASDNYVKICERRRTRSGVLKFVKIAAHVRSPSNSVECGTMEGDVEINIEKDE